MSNLVFLENILSVAWYILLERKIPGFDHRFVNGKAVAKAGEMLESIAKNNGVPTLMSFFSMSPGEVEGLAEEHGVKLKQQPAEKWFSAEDGLVTVKFIIGEGEKGHLDAHTIADLRDFQKVLEGAKQNGVGWHLAVDF
jgi:hypothetical protein